MDEVELVELISALLHTRSTAANFTLIFSPPSFTSTTLKLGWIQWVTDDIDTYALATSYWTQICHWQNLIFTLTIA